MGHSIFFCYYVQVQSVQQEKFLDPRNSPRMTVFFPKLTTT